MSDQAQITLLPAIYDAMCRAIAEAHEIDEVKDIRDKARAIEIYSQQARNFDNEFRAIRIRIRAEARCGELLREREKAKGTAGLGRPPIGGRTMQPPNSETATLADLGISKTQSSRFQQLAQVPANDFERALAEPGRPSTSRILAEHGPAREKRENVVDDGALWLWGRLLDFERDGLLERDPAEVCATMLDHMRDTVRDLAPRVAAWLREVKP